MVYYLCVDLLRDKNVKYYKKFIPKAINEDIIKCIDICIKMKDELFLKKYIEINQD